jgi:hypothetical protein
VEPCDQKFVALPHTGETVAATPKDSSAPEEPAKIVTTGAALMEAAKKRVHAAPKSAE